MKSLKNFIYEDTYTFKFGTAKQAQKILKTNLKNIPEYDDKAVAVYNALGDGEFDLYQLSKCSKLIIKDYSVKNPYKYYTDKQLDALYAKYEAIVREILSDNELSNLYEHGKNIIKKKIEDEKRAAEEAKKAARTTAYKEFCNTYKGAHLLYKSYTLYRAYSNHHLWLQKPNNVYNVIDNALKKCISSSIKSSNAVEGKTYVIIDRYGPNLERTKNTKSSGRFDIINEGAVVKYVGDDAWNVILYKDYYGYKLPDANYTKRQFYFDQDTNIVEIDIFLNLVESELNAACTELIKDIEKDIEQDIQYGRKLYPYSADVISLIKHDTI